MADVKQSIIASVFSRRNATGNLEETYVSHIKIWEDAGAEGRKARYILLSQANNRSGFIHKSKLNNNGSFSVGKTWKLSELRGLQAITPLAFNITLSRTYKWQTESQADQTNFLVALIRLFRQITGGAAPLHLEGIDSDPIEGPYQASSQALADLDNRPQRNPRPETLQTNEPPDRAPTPLTSRNGATAPRAGSPANSTRDFSSSTRPRETPLRPTGRPRKGSDAVPTQHPQALRPGMPPSAQPQQQMPTLNIPLSSVDLKGYDVDGQDGTSNSGRSRKDSHQSSTARVTPSGSSLAPDQHSRGPSPDPLSARTRKISTTRENGLTSRRDPNARVSYFDPANQQSLDRLIVNGTSGDVNGAVNGQLESDIGDEVESAQDTLASVEEMIEGYEWASDDIIGRKMARGAADLIEARLLDELMALEKANIHSFLESDDRIDTVMKFMDEALAELDNLDGLISSYKIHLNAADDDISYIQSQNRGLQVQTQNQRALLNEIENLLQTVQVDSDTLITLTQESLEKSQSISRLEQAGAGLYKALQAGRDTDMAATMERLQEYRTHNSQFCKRIHDFLTIMFTAQSKLLLGELGEVNGLTKPSKGGKPTIIQHQSIEEYLGRYCGLMLYLKEMDEAIYGRLCAAYFSAASELHSTQIKALMSIYLGYVKRSSEDEGEHVFSSTPTTPAPKVPSGMRRAGTLIRSPMESRSKDKDKSASGVASSSSSDGDIRVSEVFALVLDQIIPLIYQENLFMVDFLQIDSLNHDTAPTFADYMGLDHYFRRQAARYNGLSQATLKLVRGAMDLIFGFLPTEMKTWLEKALEKDPIEIVGVLATLERFMLEANEKANQFLNGFLSKQHTRLKGVFDRHINDQLKSVERTKSASKKRKGLVPFIRHFPQYVYRVEQQLNTIDTEGSGLEVRESVDMAYEKIVGAMFETLKTIAKMDGDEEDKGQLNYHVVIIENMHYFVFETARRGVGSVGGFTKKAKTIYDENLGAYVKLILRRPFGKIIDYFEGLERLLRTLASPTDIATNSTYSKSALRKITREYTIKDLRKHVDGLYKIVQKHFIDSVAAASAAASAPGSMTSQERDRVAATEESVGRTVLLGVWRTCEEELMKMAEGWKERVSQCYGEAAGLEFGVGDVENAFRKHRTGT